METFRDRLIDEENQLNEKIVKLENFLTSESIHMIDKPQQSLLRAQLFSMKTYSQILKERLSYIN